MALRIPYPDLEGILTHGQGYCSVGIGVAGVLVNRLAVNNSDHTVSLNKRCRGYEEADHVYLVEQRCVGDCVAIR